MTDQQRKELEERLIKLQAVKYPDLSVKSQIHSIEELLKLNKKNE